MKKVYLVLLFAIAMVTVNAQTVFTEYFEDATAGMKLEEYNDWYVSFKEADAMGESPVIEDEALFYENYAGSDIGKVAVLDSLMGQTDDTKRISTKLVKLNGDTLELGPAGSVMYASFIVSILPNSFHSYRDFFTWEASSGSNWSRGRVFVNVNDNNTDLQFGVSKNSSGDLAESEVMVGAVEVYHLLVLKYEVVEGDANDVVSLYINPDPTLAEDHADQVAPLVNIDEQSDYNENSKIKINLRQRGVGAKVGGIRVSRNWEFLLQGDPSVDVRDSKIQINRIYSYGKTIVTDAYGSIEVYDLTGRKVMSELTTGRIETQLTSGIYAVRFQDEKGNVSTGKVVLK